MDLAEASSEPPFAYEHVNWHELATAPVAVGLQARQQRFCFAHHPQTLSAFPQKRRAWTPATTWAM
jgi:hypothetical protein